MAGSHPPIIHSVGCSFESHQSRRSGDRGTYARQYLEKLISPQFCLLISPESFAFTPDRCILARPSGEVTHELFIGAEADLIRNIHGIAEVAGLDGDELGYLLGKVAEARRID